jgi:hypothetical protein
MGKMFLSLGFWMTIVLFIALGYALNNAWGSECSEGLDCGYTRATLASTNFSDSSDENHFANDPAASDVAPRKCAPAVNPQSNYPEFEQMANLQQGGPTYAPGFSFTITRHPPEASLCPGPVEIPRH